MIRSIAFIFCLTCFILASSSADGQVKLPQLIRDSMVLQRDSKLNVWGWASPKEKISIRFGQKRLKTTTGADGKWKTQLPPMKAGGPFTMEITGKNKIILKEILMGDVWFCSGQSNMVGIGQVTGGGSR